MKPLILPVRHYVSLLEKERNKMKVFVIGSGSWGSALAQICVDNGHEVLIYGNNAAEINEINTFHTNSKYFDDVVLNEKLQGTLDISKVADADIVVMSVPSAVTSEVCAQIQPFLTKKIILVNTSKGFDPTTGKRMSEAIRSVFDKE